MRKSPSSCNDEHSIQMTRKCITESPNNSMILSALCWCIMVITEVLEWKNNNSNQSEKKEIKFQLCCFHGHQLEYFVKMHSKIKYNPNRSFQMKVITYETYNTKEDENTKMENKTHEKFNYKRAIANNIESA